MERHIPGDREPFEADGKEQEEDQAKPVARYGETGDDEGARQLIDPGPARTAAAVPSTSAIVMAMSQGGDDQLQRRNELRFDQIEDLVIALDRDAEIAGDRVPQPDDVLDWNRLVETQFLPQRGDALRIAGATRPKLLLDGISRRQADQDEDERRGQEDHGHQLQQAADNDGRHVPRTCVPHDATRVSEETLATPITGQLARR